MLNQPSLRRQLFHFPTVTTAVSTFSLLFSLTPPISLRPKRFLLHHFHVILNHDLNHDLNVSFFRDPVKTELCASLGKLTRSLEIPGF